MNSGAILVALVSAGLAGALAGFVLHRFVSWLLDEIEGAEGTQDGQVQGFGKSASRYRSVTIVAGCLVVVGIVWWEVIYQGLLPHNVVRTAANPSALFIRAWGHLIFFWFLAAAAWVDIRYRVIPDVITTPGVLCGVIAFPVIRSDEFINHIIKLPFNLVNSIAGSVNDSEVQVPSVIIRT